MIEKRICASCALTALVLLGTRCAGAADSEVQRQLQQREQHQTELRLKMQQQLDRAMQPRQGPSFEVRRRQLEREQQQRLQMLHDQQLRGTIGPGAGGEMRREIERQRDSKANTEELRRFGAQRRLEAERAGTDR